MRKPIYVRPLSREEREAVERGLHSADAFTLRRCQIVLASSRGKRASQVAQDLSCDGDTVTKAIKSAIARIGEQSPALGNHLARTVRTGTFCSYVPDPRLAADWRL